MPLSIYKKLGLGEAKTTNVCLQLADKTIKKPEGIMENVLVKTGKFIFSVDFVVLDFKEDENVPLKLGMPFLYTTKVIIDVYDVTLTLRIGEESCKFDLYQDMKHSFEKEFCMRVDMVDDYMNKVQ